MKRTHLTEKEGPTSTVGTPSSTSAAFPEPTEVCSPKTAQNENMIPHSLQGPAGWVPTASWPVALYGRLGDGIHASSGQGVAA